MAAATGFLTYLLTMISCLPASLEGTRSVTPPRRGTLPAPVPDPALPLIIRYYDEIPLPTARARDRLERLRILHGRAIVHTPTRLQAVSPRLFSGSARRRWGSLVVVLGKGGKQRIVYLTRLACKAIRLCDRELTLTSPSSYPTAATTVPG